MSSEDVAKRALELAARAQELARNAHETANIDEQLAQLEAELDALDAEEARADAGVDADEPPGGAQEKVSMGWAEGLTDRLGSLGDRVGALVDQITDATLHAVDASFDVDSEVSEERRLPMAEPMRVRVESDGGSVRVHAHDQPELTVVGSGKRSQSSDNMLNVEQRDGEILVSCRDRSWWRRRGMRLDIALPVGCELVVLTGGGRVEVQDVHAALDVRTGGGSITVTGARGQLRLATGGGSIAVDDLDGSISADTGGGSIKVAGRLRGDSRLRTGGGAITVQPHAESSIHVEAQGTGSFTDIEGLEASHGRIAGSINDGSDGKLRAQTGAGAVRIVR